MNKKQFMVLVSLYLILATPISMLLTYLDSGYSLNNLFWSSQVSVLIAGGLMLFVVGIVFLIIRYEHLFDRLGDN